MPLAFHPAPRPPSPTDDDPSQAVRGRRGQPGGGDSASISRSGPGLAAGDVADHALLRGFALGDPTIGAAFVRRFQGRVYGLAIHLLGDQGLAQDVAQEVFVRAWKHAGAYDPQRGSVAAWLSRITRNLAIDTLRRRRPQALHPETVEALTPTSPTTSVEDAAITTDLAARARVAIGRLPPGQAKAVWLSAFYGHTARQIAQFEGIPLGTVKTRIRQGLRTLRAQLIEPDNTAPTNQPTPPPRRQAALA